MTRALIVSTIILSIAIIITGLFGLAKFGDYLKQNAIAGCMKSATVQSQSISTKDQSTYTTTYTLPQEEWFNRCMNEQGYGK